MALPKPVFRKSKEKMDWGCAKPKEPAVAESVASGGLLALKLRSA